MKFCTAEPRDYTFLGFCLPFINSMKDSLKGCAASVPLLLFEKDRNNELCLFLSEKEYFCNKLFLIISEWI